jgi:hypothetical protein
MIVQLENRPYKISEGADMPRGKKTNNKDLATSTTIDT